MTQAYPETDGILAGVLALQTSGDTATRSLSRTGLFHVLSRLTSITVRDVEGLFRARYSERAVQRYAEAARVASNALTAYIGTLGKTHALKRRTSRLADMRAIDAPYAVDAAKAEALCLSLPFRRGADTLPELSPEERTPAAILRRRGKRDA